MVNLTKKKLLSINGGHNGESYNAGVEVGKFITKAGTLMSVLALVIFVPKS